MARSWKAAAGRVYTIGTPRVGDRGSLAGMEDLGDAEQISDAGADLSFALQGWTAFVATRRRRSQAPLGPPASPPAFQPKLDSAVHPLPRQAPSSGDG